MLKRLIVLIAVLSGCSFAAELSLPTIFSDHMVLQRERAVPVWGKADPGVTVTVEFAGQKKTATAGTDGKWRIDLKPLEASAEPRALTVSAGDLRITVQDILVGEVWLCSGQSNMEMPMKGFKIPLENGAEAIAAANLPALRLYKTPKVAAGVPKEIIESSWTTCTPETAAEFSATAFYFGRKIQQDLNVPVGLLQSAWGGTRIEPWTPPCGFEGIDSLKEIHQQSQKLTELPKITQKEPSSLYNGMIYAHVPFAIRGAIWYQGEANHRENAMLYVDKTRALLNGWRKLWGYEFPYYFVQIAPFKYGEEDPSVLPAFWEAEAEIVKTIPKTGMAVINDVATLNDIHPTNKEAPGTRLALLAEANTYGMKVVSTGPVFQTLEKQGGKLKVIFSSAAGLTTRDGKAPDWFEVAGKEGGFKKAEAKIDGQAVIVQSGEVAEPVAVRFAWHKLATPNLMNGAGLPAAAFRAGDLSVEQTAAATEETPTSVKLPEANGFRIVYQLNIPETAAYATQAPKYIVDNSAKETAPFSRIAFYLELEKKDGTKQYAFAAMDAFTTDVKKAGVPVNASGARFMQKISNLTVRSNVPGVAPCTDSDGGNIEFWPGNYTPPNQQNIPEADPKKFDFGDSGNDKVPGYGCMQIHNWKEKQTVLAFNHWGGTTGPSDVGIGNAPQGMPDWTFSKNAADYTVRRLTVLVK
jgi:sialate O-acetylesterase